MIVNLKNSSTGILLFILTGILFFSASLPYDHDAQVLAERNVESYIRKKFGKEIAYKSYNFGHIYRLKKQEQKELDELIQSRKLLPEMKNHYGNKLDSVIRHYDTLIAVKKRSMAAQNIKSDYIISHIWTIRNADGSGIVYEGDFILNDTLGVKSFNLGMGVDLAKDDFDWFYYFFMKYPIFNTGDYDKDIAMSNSVFDYYNTRLLQLKEGKDEFLVTALRATRIINKTKKYDKDIIAGFITMKKLDEQKICTNYRPLKFTDIEEIKVKVPKGDSLIGYKLFHLYECTDEKGQSTKKAVYTEMDPYFMPAGFLNVEPPFEKYFEKK